MNTNHNRIKVADLETNQANKILKTNQNGELEFSDSNNLQTENYNALDCITEGKPLDARQGKVLKDLIDNNSLDLSSDSETQINSPIPEDKKIISRLKLFNWWEWAKYQTQTISGIWNFTNKVTLASGTTTMPALIIPNGTLTSTYQNGAIERDENGQLWETHSWGRSKLLTTADNLILIAFKNLFNIQINLAGTISGTATNVSSSIIIGKIANESVLRLNALNEVYYPSSNSGTIAPIVAKTEVFLKINNGLFATWYTGQNSTNQVKIMEFSGLNNNGFKNYQNSIMTNIQNHDPLIAQWSTIQLVVQTINNGAILNEDATYYLRNSDNTRTFGASEASFSFVFKTTVTYADATNANGLNTDRTIRLNNYALYIETIR